MSSDLRNDSKVPWKMSVSPRLSSMENLLPCRSKVVLSLAKRLNLRSPTRLTELPWMLMLDN